jgi:hypothetical protein
MYLHFNLHRKEHFRAAKFQNISRKVIKKLKITVFTCVLELAVIKAISPPVTTSMHKKNQIFTNNNS